MSCCGLLPLARQRFRRRKVKKPDGSAENDNMEETPHVQPDTTEDQYSEMEVYERLSMVDYVGTGYCGLCRTQLPHNPLPVVETRSETWQQWEGDLRAVLCIDHENESDCVITDPFRATNADYDAEKTVKIHHAEYGYVRLQLKIALLDNILAYVFHSWCYDVLQWRIGRKDPEFIYRLTKSLSHESSPWETIGLGEGWLDPPSRIKTLIGDMNDEQSSKLQPIFLSQLPSELRAPIWGFVGTRSAYSSFLLVSEETVRLVPKLEKASSGSLQLSKGSFLHTEKIDVFGMSFLRKLVNEQSKEAVQIQEDLVAIRIIASLPGICAMKLIGRTWESDWIGQIPAAGQIWYGTLKGPGSKVDTVFTGLTCLDIKHKPAPQLMWDRPDFPAQLMERDMLRDEAVWLRINSTSRFEFIRYLPLFCGREAAKGITMFCSPSGIIGMASHFQQTNYFSGYRDGLPIYIPLSPGEGIKNIWYRLGEGNLDAPGLVIQTTKNRAHHIGPYMSPAFQALQCRWAPMNNYLYTSITGIFYQNPRREIYCCSVLGNGRSVLPITQVPGFPHSNIPVTEDFAPQEKFYLSTAKFEGAREITVCVIEKRCMGLLIRYVDGSEATLGQWFVRDTYPTARYETVYSHTEGGGEPASMAFTLAKEGENQYITKVAPRMADERLQAECIYLVWYLSAAWWFSTDYDDILIWGEEIFDIPMEYQVFLQ